MTARGRLGILILSTLLFGMMVALLPLGGQLNSVRPELLTMLVIYWGIYYPNRLRLGHAWFIGLLQDIFTGSLLGQQALSLAVVSYSANQLRHRMQLYTTLQQTFMVFILIGIGQLLRAGIQIFIGHPPHSWHYWLTTISSMFLWPFLARGLHNRIRRWVLKQGPIALATA